MKDLITLFVGTFFTLVAIINPLEAMPIYLKLLHGQDQKEHRAVAIKSCTYALILMFVFLLFGNLLLKIFNVPLSMVRIVGGIILMRVGFELFLPSNQNTIIPSADNHVRTGNVAFVPLAMPLMFGPGAIATILSMTSMASSAENKWISILIISAAIFATMLVTCLFLLFARKILSKIGEVGIDAATRLIGFFVSAIGMGLIFHGIIEALQTYKIIPM